MAEECAKTSAPPSSGEMKPKPFSELNHLTVPWVLMYCLFCWKEADAGCPDEVNASGVRPERKSRGQPVTKMLHEASCHDTQHHRYVPEKLCGPHRGGSDEGRRRPEGASGISISPSRAPCPPFGGHSSKIFSRRIVTPSSSPVGTDLIEGAQSHGRIIVPLGEAFVLWGRTTMIDIQRMQLHTKGRRVTRTLAHMRQR